LHLDTNGSWRFGSGKRLSDHRNRLKNLIKPADRKCREKAIEIAVRRQVYEPPRWLARAKAFIVTHPNPARNFLFTVARGTSQGNERAGSYEAYDWPATGVAARMIAELHYHRHQAQPGLTEPTSIPRTRITISLIVGVADGVGGSFNPIDPKPPIQRAGSGS